MPRIQLIEQREGLSPTQGEVFDDITASRGSVLRPFALLLHRPEIARAVAALGTVIRYEGRLPDAVRELVIYTTAVEQRCGFEQTAHRTLAIEAGVSAATLEAVDRRSAPADRADAAVVSFVRQLCETGTVAARTFEELRAEYEDESVVEVVSTAGYYTMLAMLLNAFEAC
jgi:4-carboxymuconolactone decarboxylase